MTIASVIGMHHERRVPEHGFRPCCGDGYRLTASGDGVANVPEMPFCGFVNGFYIRDSGLAVGTPVDHVLAAIDEPALPQAHEGFAYGTRKSGIHGEAFPRPI